MKTKKNIIIFIIILSAFVIILVGAYFLYDYLSDSLPRESLVDETNTNQNANSNQDNQNEDNASKQTSPAPDFTMKDKNGNIIKLSEMIGTPIILNFWASWCGPCKIEMPDFEEAFLKYGDKINFMMVNLTDNYSETVTTASEYIQSQGYSFPIYFDTEGEGAYAYQVYSIPATYFIDADGNITAYARGALDKNNLQRGIDMIFPENKNDED